MNTKINALLASLLMAAALGTAAHAEDKVGLSKGTTSMEQSTKEMPAAGKMATQETGKAAQKPVAQKAVKKAAHKVKKAKHHKKHVAKKHKAVKTSAKAPAKMAAPAAKPAK